MRLYRKRQGRARLLAALDALPESGTVLPTQLLTRGRVGSPATRLVLAMLEEALDCAIGIVSGEKTADKAACVAAARAWIASDESWLYSFTSVCAALDLDPRMVRSWFARQRRLPRAVCGAPWKEARWRVPPVRRVA